jgi:hypothetical protein
MERNMKSSADGKIHRVAGRMSLFWFVLASFTFVYISIDAAVAQKGNPPEKSVEEFDRSKFERSTAIDNRWFPLKPGTRHVFKGFSQDGSNRVPQQVVTTVTNLVKTIDGVRTVVVWEQDYKDGTLQEEEIVFFAQDSTGTVWNFGQLREAYDDQGDYLGAVAWISGAEGAKAGIVMQATPKQGTPSYSQGFAPPPLNRTDRGKVDQTGQSNCVPAGCHKDVVVIAESSAKEGSDSAAQLKFYAPGVGYIRMAWRGNPEKAREMLELAEIVQLAAADLVKANEAALQLEKRAYAYSRTAPAELRAP